MYIGLSVQGCYLFFMSLTLQFADPHPSTPPPRMEFFCIFLRHDDRGEHAVSSVIPSVARNPGRYVTPLLNVVRRATV